uniref:hypothetical protein n=1 Tax=Burkholderia diffusa TaxID=488732 RepID=UPI001CC3BF5E
MTNKMSITDKRTRSRQGNSMKKRMLILTLATVATSAAAGEQVSLMLETNLQDPDPQVVYLRDAVHCKYVGTLQPSSGWEITIR